MTTTLQQQKTETEARIKAWEDSISAHRAQMAIERELLIQDRKTLALVNRLIERDPKSVDPRAIEVWNPSSGITAAENLVASNDEQLT